MCWQGTLVSSANDERATDVSEKPTQPKREFTEDEARKFWDNARAKATKGDCDFRGVFFPEDPDSKGFDGVTFGGDADFCEAKFSGDADFCGAEFGGDADFSCANFGGDVTFLDSKFGGNADFSLANFGGDANFLDSKFGGDAGFSFANFGGDAGFEDAKFSGDANFGGARFGGAANFNYAVSGGVFLLGLPRKERKGQRIPFAKRIEGDGAYRLAKQSAADRGDYRMAGQFHHIEQSTICLRRFGGGWAHLRDQTFRGDGLKVGKLSRRLRGLGELISAVIELLFAKLLFGYGERIRGVLIAAAVVIAGFALLYCVKGVVVNEVTVATTATAPARMAYDWGSSLYFSIVTFTTLGYGDLRPPEDLRLWAATEAIMGAFLMALFVVTMARKFIR